MLPSRTSVLALLGGSLLGLASIGCAHTPPLVDSGALPLRRVVVYRNGVAYFERAGVVETNEVKFRVRPGQVGDFLATMAVLEKGGSSVKSASFPLKIDDDEDEPEPLDDGAPTPRKKKKKPGDGLVDVLLSLDGRRHDLQVGYVAEMPVWRPSYRLVVREGGVADLQAWGIVQNLSGEDWRGIRLSLVAGAPISFQPMLGQPIIPSRPIVTDAGEVIFAVPGAETTLEQRPQPSRPAPAPSVTAADKEFEGGLGLTGIGAGGGGLGEGIGHGSLGTKPSGSRAKQKRAAGATGGGALPKPARVMAKADEARDEDWGAAPPAAASAAPPPEALSRPRDVSALAGVAVEGSTTRYDIPVPVDVPDESATMVMLLSSSVPGESVFLFAPSGAVSDSSAHPFRVARFTNQSSGLLERGPIAVFEGGAFLGEGMVDPLPPGATATVPFALERAIAVEQSRNYGETGARVAQIEAGTLYIDRDLQFKTTYKIKNGRDGVVKVVLKHPRNVGARLFEPPKGTEDNTGTHTALVPVEVPSKGSLDHVVEERMTTTRSVDWLSDLANEAVLAYIGDSRAQAPVSEALKRAWDIRPGLIKSRDDFDALSREETELMRTTNETRENLKAIEKNPLAAALRKELTDRLQKAAARLNEIGKRKIEVSLSMKEQQVRFYDIVRGIKLAKGLPAPT